MKTTTLTFDKEQLYLIIDAMECFDVAYHYQSEEYVVEFEKILNRLYKSYQKLGAFYPYQELA